MRLDGRSGSHRRERVRHPHHILEQVFFHRRWWVLGVGLLLSGVAAVYAGGAVDRLSSGGFDDKDSESSRSAQLLEDRLGRQAADVIVVYRSPTRTVDDPAFRSAVTVTLAGLPRDAVASATTFWSSGSTELVSRDRRATYASLRLEGSDPEEREAAYGRIRDRLAAPGLDALVGGVVPVDSDISERVERDIVRAERASLPVVLLLLTVAFGGLVASVLPVVVGVLSILGALALVRLLTLVTDVSVFSVNVITILGLGLAIDYALFVVSRFREELGLCKSVEEAVASTVASAGHTILVSAFTVASSLASLTLFPQTFLRSMGIGGVLAVAVAGLCALTVLPALLAVLGHRVDALPVRRRWRRPRTTRRWFRLANAVMRRPLAFTVATLGFLLVLGLPFLQVSFGGVDARTLPAGTPSRVTFEVLERDFPAGFSRPVDVALTAESTVAGRQVEDYLRRLDAIPGVAGVNVGAARDDVSHLQVAVAADPASVDARNVVARIRDVPPPDGSEALVGGETAALVDLLDSLGRTLPLMVLAVVGSTVTVLLVSFRSVVLPVKAVVVSTLSMAATFGVLVWIFQYGHLSGPLGFTPTGRLDATQPILVFAIAFGLSTDYEVFLLSRIRENYLITGDNSLAIATGLQRTGWIITSAALLFVIVVASLATSSVAFLKLVGIGLAFAVIVDATVVRALLVPAVMQLTGRANWWAPSLFRRPGRNPRGPERPRSEVPAMSAPVGGWSPDDSSWYAAWPPVAVPASPPAPRTAAPATAAGLAGGARARPSSGSDVDPSPGLSPPYVTVTELALRLHRERRREEADGDHLARRPYGTERRSSMAERW